MLLSPGSWYFLPSNHRFCKKCTGHASHASKHPKPQDKASRLWENCSQKLAPAIWYDYWMVRWTSSTRNLTATKQPWKSGPGPAGLAALTTSIVTRPRQEAAEPEVGVLIALLQRGPGMGWGAVTEDICWVFWLILFVAPRSEAVETMKPSWGRFNTHVMFAQECWPHCLHHQWSSSSLPAFVSPPRAGVWMILHQLAPAGPSHTNGAGNFSC